MTLTRYAVQFLLLAVGFLCGYQTHVAIDQRDNPVRATVEDDGTKLKVESRIAREGCPNQ